MTCCSCSKGVTELRFGNGADAPAMPNILVRELGASVPALLKPLVEHVGLALGSVAVVFLASRALDGEPMPLD